jgi:hypothetical protein
MSDASREAPLVLDWITKAIVISASVTVLTRDSFGFVSYVEVVTFEPGSQLLRLETETFDFCRRLKSICIAASVEFIGGNCFCAADDGMRRLFSPAPGLETVTFEPGSKLREIEPDAFDRCDSLKRLQIPASVEKMTGGSFPDSGDCHIEIEPGNRYFGWVGDFVMNLSHPDLLRYYGTGSEITISDEIEKIDDCCFRFRHSIDFVRFGSLPRLSSIGILAFADCTNLKSISIPASVESLGDLCFRRCESLQIVSFCAGSKLQSIPHGAFQWCHSLESIILPSSVKTLGVRCFDLCEKLRDSPLPLDSEVIRIEESAFVGCRGLTSMILPPSLEFVGIESFALCRSISRFTFVSPSHLRELLDIPSELSGAISIPDSVEILSFVGSLVPRQCQRTLKFGCDSRLTQISAKSPFASVRCRSFVQVSSGSLKIFRMKMEFAGGV